MKRIIILAIILVAFASVAFAQYDKYIGQKADEFVPGRVAVYAEGDSLVMKYVLSQDMEFWAVNADGTMIGPNEIESLKSVTLWLDKKGVPAFIKPDGVYSKIPWPKAGIHDFTWEFKTISGGKAYSLVSFSPFATIGNTRDTNAHFEMEVTKNKLVIPLGTPGKK